MYIILYVSTYALYTDSRTLCIRMTIIVYVKINNRFNTRRVILLAVLRKDNVHRAYVQGVIGLFDGYNDATTLV